ncbi:DNA cytosine methyltransferase [Glutamicibacter sp. BW77]|uniref:DNA cytosine methyltransferase n=1 Tax=Glutamicibacter sp. BW77 TaxID=2024402 RepID=UPI000BB8F054|nr:DNA cytosine methyltransferase [Glutamicibacter sp. BW77]PCC36920.1 hypothetical protein CIK74_03715 [Glutamicibacter sp. BW77]
MIPVIDVFAGPGGLNEGFSSVVTDDGLPAFKTVASIEMEESAVKTLSFRSAVRRCRSSNSITAKKRLESFFHQEIPLEELLSDESFSPFYQSAQTEVHRIELGVDTRPLSDLVIHDALARERSTDWVLIGGPPCQAYSLAGRSRRKNDATFEDDHKHFLYREYLHIIQKHKPTIFVMENVKGLLSSVNKGVKMFDLIRADLEHPTEDLQYTLHSMVVSKTGENLSAEDFLIRAEDYGVPQKRHRIIIVGVRVGAEVSIPEILSPRTSRITVGDAILSLPKLRSSVSRTADPDGSLWKQALDHMKVAARPYKFKKQSGRTLPTRSSAVANFEPKYSEDSLEKYQTFVRPESIKDIPTWNHEARSHMISDLIRYGVLSARSAKEQKSIKVRDLDRHLWPNHKNISGEFVPFEDRFRVQIESSPSTTIVSHIAKDGHYYIHPDPAQMRSLTVREAARLQSFPDDYIFLGNRTQQYTQVGNAVPPLLAQQIGEKILSALRPPNG